MPAFKALKARHREIRDSHPEHLRVRIHRALSWLERSERESEDLDIQFVLLWISLNAAYAREFGLGDRERKRVHEFLRTLVGLDADGSRLQQGLHEKFSGPIRTLIENKYTYYPFWEALRDHDSSERWKKRFETERKDATKSLLNRDTSKVLTIVFDRLYVLRNQLVHGGATWAGSVNRQQVRDGAAILRFLVPLVIEIMMDNPEFDHGDVLYPVT